MGLIHIKQRGGDEEYRFKDALKMAKESIMEICEIYEEMEDEYGSESDERYSRRDYSRRGNMRDGMGERRMRDSMGRYR